MQMGMVGLGRMGASMVRRLMRGGHECVVYDVNADAVARVVKEGAPRHVVSRCLRRGAEEAEGRLDDGAGRGRGTDGRSICHIGSNAATSSSTAATRTTSTTFAARRYWPRTAFTTWMPARAAASGGSSAASAR